MLKKLAPYILSSIVAAGIFYCGMAVGMNDYFVLTDKSEFSENAANLAETTALLANLQSDDKDGMKYMLVSKQDSEIFQLHLSLDSLNEDSQQRVKKLFQVIAKKRQENKEFYQLEGYLNSQVSSILSEYN